MAERQYTLEEIKKAFWAEFHESGEHFFPYKLGGEENKKCDEVTEAYWSDFVNELNKVIKE